MIYTQGNDGIKKQLIYNESVLLINKDDYIYFEIRTTDFAYDVKFTFSQEGEKLTTTYWADLENKYLHYQLNNWDSNTYAEVSSPVELKVIGDDSRYYMKFRNTSAENINHRRFEICIWKEVKLEK